MMGRATPAATRALAGNAAIAYREAADGLTLSTIGLGMAHGDSTDATDAAMTATVRQAFALGCNIFDTAIADRHQRSERAIGAALADGAIPREAVVLVTKGGVVPFDDAEPAEPKKYIYERYIANGLVHPNEFAAGYRHCIAPPFLEAMLAMSLRNLGVETIDVYLLHNPETQAITLSYDTFRRRMLDAFETLEQAVERGQIASYGISTWSGGRVAPDAPDFLALTSLVGLAYEVAGAAHHFRWVELPYNLLMPEAFALENQQLDDSFLSPLACAEALGLSVLTSAPLMQGRLTVPLVPHLPDALPGLATDAQRALEFARSTPGVAAALVGTLDAAHLAEDMALLRREPAPPETIRSLFGL